jgi:L-lactate dehydrogenase complex protein LldE
MANSGCVDQARPLALKFNDVFRDYEYVVAPSGSCVSMVRNHYSEFWPAAPGLRELGARTFELCEFLYDVVGIRRSEGRFPHRVGLHQSCHGLRELGLGRPSELMTERVDKVRCLLESLDGIRFTDLTRPDECCGFGGTFAVAEEAMSVMMGLDRLADHERAGSEVLTSVDMSCLMHLDGLIRRRKLPVHVLHVAQILAGRPLPAAP